MGQCVTHLQYSMSATLDEVDEDSGETVVDRQHKAEARHVVAPSHSCDLQMPRGERSSW